MLLAVVAILLAALFHVVAFVLESVLFTRPAVWRRFGVASQRDADATRLFALNQGFYNLFLAAGAVAGVVAVALGHDTVGATLIAFAAACMTGAGVVLVASGGARLARTGAIQALFPVLALVGLLVA